MQECLILFFFSGYLLKEQVEDLTKSTETALCQDTSMPTGKFVTILHYECFIVAMYPDDFVISEDLQ